VESISGVEHHCHQHLLKIWLRLQIPKKAIEEEELIVPDLAAHTLIAHTFIMFVAHPRRQLHRRGGPLVRFTRLTGRRPDRKVVLETEILMQHIWMGHPLEHLLSRNRGKCCSLPHSRHISFIATRCLRDFKCRLNVS